MFEKKNKSDEEINKLWANAIKLGEKIDELEEKLNKLKESLKAKEEKMEEKTFKSTISGFITPEDYKKMEGICYDIADKDKTFEFEANSDIEEIYVYSPDKDQLHKKCMWLIKKTNIEELKYTIR
jgi:hypothetical protein